MPTNHSSLQQRLRRLSPKALAWALLLAGFIAQAQPADPPARAGRVAELSGSAWVFDAESRQWEALSRNQTIAEGDRLRTDDNGRLALRVGSVSVWLDARSDLLVQHLDDDRIELQLDDGSAALRIRRTDVANELRLRTREGQFRFELDGFYRIDQLDRGSRAAVRSGRLRFESRDLQALPVWLGEREQAEFWWAQGPRVERQAWLEDDFSVWLSQQNAQDRAPQAYNYVSPEMTGAEDLDRYGRWETVSEYGAVWFPQQVAVDWAPYRHGRWVWSRHWGWTWVDEAPWGFAPFHYGRWVQHRGRWCWVPGRYVARPVYAPALVGWVGSPQVHVDIRIGHRPPQPRVGWYPLSPHESFVPGFRHTPHYQQRVNGGWPTLTVQRPGSTPPRSNRDVGGAISLVPDGQSRPQPGTGRDWQSLTEPPRRHELPVWGQARGDANQRPQPGRPHGGAEWPADRPTDRPSDRPTTLPVSRPGLPTAAQPSAPTSPGALPSPQPTSPFPVAPVAPVAPAMPAAPAVPGMPTTPVTPQQRPSVIPSPTLPPVTPVPQNGPDRRLPERELDAPQRRWQERSNEAAALPSMPTNNGRHSATPTATPSAPPSLPPPVNLPQPQWQAPQPAPAPVQERRWERPERQIERPIERVPERATERSFERAVERPAERPTERPVERAIEQRPPERSQLRVPEAPQRAPAARSEEPRQSPPRNRERDDGTPRRATER